VVARAGEEVFAEMGERFKVELIDAIGDQQIQDLPAGDWFDLAAART